MALNECECRARIRHIHRDPAVIAECRRYDLRDTSESPLGACRDCYALEHRRSRLEFARHLRRKDSPRYIRLDTVRQDDLDGAKGVYHINAVDIVTQWELAPQWSRPSADATPLERPRHKPRLADALTDASKVLPTRLHQA